ncbi:MAG TPA: flavin reductase family protein [Clostridiaceae bacterium]|nr:flavin reductase family protein [Clostridiaceae bacterium]
MVNRAANQRISDSFYKEKLPQPSKRSMDPGTLLAPVPVVMISTGGSCYSVKRPNIITVAWAGTLNSDPPIVGIGVRPERYSYDAILKSGEFVINLVSRDLVSRCDYCGVTSGREVDKFAACGLTPVPIAPLEDAPAIAESPLNLACRVTGHSPLPSHDLILGEVVGIEAATSLFDSDNALHLERADLISYIHGQYYELGKLLGFFGYSIARPEVLARRLKK